MAAESVVQALSEEAEDGGAEESGAEGVEELQAEAPGADVDGDGGEHVGWGGWCVLMLRVMMLFDEC